MFACLQRITYARAESDATVRATGREPNKSDRATKRTVARGAHPHTMHVPWFTSAWRQHLSRACPTLTKLTLTVSRTQSNIWQSRARAQQPQQLRPGCVLFCPMHTA